MTVSPLRGIVLRPPLLRDGGFATSLGTLLEAEAAGVDFAVLAQGDTEDPAIAAAALLARTGSIGIIVEARLADHRPYNLARRIASLDLAGEGRVGLLADPSGIEAADEYLAVLEGLWCSWEPNAFSRDRATGRFFDPQKMHPLHHSGEHFSVRGPLNVEPSRQSRPVLAMRLAASALTLAARHADIVIVTPKQDALLAAFGVHPERRGTAVRVFATSADECSMQAEAPVPAPTYKGPPTLRQRLGLALLERRS